MEVGVQEPPHCHAHVCVCVCVCTRMWVCAPWSRHWWNWQI